jgi:tetratricopeptide (TPR) repeat protein
MYTIAVELHGLTQLERLNPSLVDDVQRQCIAAIEIQGGTFVESSHLLQLFRFHNARPEDHNAVVECIEQVIGILKGRESELAGWNLYIDYIQARDDEVAAIITDQLALVSEDDCAWLGDDAYSLIGRYLQIEEVQFGRRLYRRVLRSESSGSLPSGTVEQLAASAAAVDGILDLLDPNEMLSGAILVHSEDMFAARVNATAALTKLSGESHTVGWLEFEPREDSGGYGPLVSSLNELHLHETRFWLSEAEQAVWDERVATLHFLMHPHTNLCLPDRLSVDLICTLEHYLAAYVRRTEAALSPPVLLCHAIDRWPSASVDAFASLLTRFEESADQRPPLVLATASTASVPSALRSLVRHKYRIPRLTTTQIREAADGLGGANGHTVNWERAYRITAHRSDSVLHYLMDSRYWDRLPEGELADVTPQALAWHVVASLDRDIQEAFLAICYVGRLLRTDDLLELLTDLGIDRVRVTAVITRLRSLGIIQHGGQIVPTFPEHLSRLEIELAESGQTVFQRVARGCDRLLEDGRLIVTEEMLKRFGGFENGVHVPRLYHMLVSRLLDERQLAESHRMLYDAVPTNSPVKSAKLCMQAVLYTNRLRLALLQSNLQEAERVRSAAERIDPVQECGFVEGDLTLERSRLCARIGTGRETLTLIKRAIMIYQDRDDKAGLARGNLDFGLVLLAQEDVLEAREYFQLAKKMAAASGDLFEQIRADVLQMTSTFIHGNFSRVFSQARDLAARTSKAGMREIQLFCELVTGRSHFELGRYEDAAASFERGRSRARFYGWKAPGDLFRRWLARSLIYDSRTRRGMKMLGDEPEGRESCFFLGEAWLRIGDHGKAIDALDRAMELPADPRSSVEAIAWNTGYAGLEDRAIGVFDGIRVIDHQILALRGYVLAESGRLEEGVQEMHRLTREVPVSEIDPFNRLYYYLYSSILPESGDLNIEDRNTVLGRAVRYIQERTSRLDEYTHKTDFLKRNYWNNRLMSHAQSSNLV